MESQGWLSGTLTSLTQLHVPEPEHLYEVTIGMPRRPMGLVPKAALRDAPWLTMSDLELSQSVAHLFQDQEQPHY